jgi:hypothetical protein
MADGRFDAPCHRMKRLESWLVFIDAEPMASDLGIRPHDASAYYQVFPIPEIRSHIRLQFRSGRLVEPCRNRNFAI